MELLFSRRVTMVHRTQTHTHTHKLLTNLTDAHTLAHTPAKRFKHTHTHLITTHTYVCIHVRHTAHIHISHTHSHTWKSPASRAKLRFVRCTFRKRNHTNTYSKEEGEKEKTPGNLPRAGQNCDSSDALLQLLSARDAAQ